MAGPFPPDFSPLREHWYLGIVPLLWTLPGAVTASLVVLFVGLAASFAILWRVQRRYNGGML